MAPAFGRTSLCSNAAFETPVLSCVLNRSYTTPEMKEVLSDLAAGLDRAIPGTRGVLLDANFPFLDGVRLLPHLSHDDGRNADIALFYRDATGYLPEALRSPVG